MQTRSSFTTAAARRPLRRAGFTLVEIMIVVLIIGVLLNIAAPAFVQSRDKSQAKSCVKTLNSFMVAKEQYAMDNKIAAGNASSVHITWPQISTYMKVSPSTSPTIGPLCPTNNQPYDLQPLSILPTCSYGASSANPQAVHSL